MAFANYRRIFKASLGGIEVRELYELDYNLEKLKERRKYIDDKIKKVKTFYDEYIFDDNHYKVNLSKDDDLSFDINIFRALEKDANYILNSSDISKSKQNKYIFLSEEEFKKLLRKESSIHTLIEAENETGEVMAILKRDFENDYVNLSFCINKKDLERADSGQVLKEYDKMRNFLKEQIELNKAKKEYKVSLPVARRMLKSVNDDMLLAKKQLQGTRCQAKRLGDESGKFYSELIDYTNEKHIEAILTTIKLGSLDPSSDLSHIAFDMKNTIDVLFKTKKIDKLDLDIIEAKNYGIKNTELARENGISETAIRKRFKKICHKISEYFENLEK